MAKVGLAKVGLAKVGLAKVGLAKVGLAKVGLAKVGLAKVGRIRMAKVGLAKVGFDLRCFLLPVTIQISSVMRRTTESVDGFEESVEGDEEVPHSIPDTAVEVAIPQRRSHERDRMAWTSGGFFRCVVQ